MNAVSLILSFVLLAIIIFNIILFEKVGKAMKKSAVLIANLSRIIAAQKEQIEIAEKLITMNDQIIAKSREAIELYKRLHEMDELQLAEQEKFISAYEQQLKKLLKLIEELRQKNKEEGEEWKKGWSPDNPPM